MPKLAIDRNISVQDTVTTQPPATPTATRTHARPSRLVAVLILAAAAVAAVALVVTLALSSTTGRAEVLGQTTGTAASEVSCDIPTEIAQAERLAPTALCERAPTAGVPTARVR